MAITYIHNRLPDHRQRAPIAKLLSADPPDLSRLRALGCRCVIPNHRRRHNKQHDPGLAGTMVGYSADSYAYMIGIANGTVMEAANVLFFENNSARKRPSSEHPPLPDHLLDLQPTPPVSSILNTTDLRSTPPPSIVLAVPGLTYPPPLLRIDAETPTAVVVDENGPDRRLRRTRSSARHLDPIVERSFWTSESSVGEIPIDNNMTTQFFEEIWMAVTSKDAPQPPNAVGVAATGYITEPMPIPTAVAMNFRLSNEKLPGSPRTSGPTDRGLRGPRPHDECRMGIGDLTKAHPVPPPPPPPPPKSETLCMRTKP